MGSGKATQLREDPALLRPMLASHHSWAEPRSGLIPQGGGGGGSRWWAERETPRRGRDGSTSQRSWDARGGDSGEVDGEGGWRVGALSGAKAQMGEGPTVLPLSPPNRLHPRGGGSGAQQQQGRSPGGECAAAGRRRWGTCPWGQDTHADWASGLSRPPHSGESCGGREAGMGHGCKAGKSPQGVAAGCWKHRRQGQDGEQRTEDVTPPHHTRGPLLRDARPSPNPDTPRATTPKGRLRLEEALKGETNHRGLAGQGTQCDLMSPSPLLRAVSTWPQRQGT